MTEFSMHVQWELSKHNNLVKVEMIGVRALGVWGSYSHAIPSPKCFVPIFLFLSVLKIKLYAVS